MVKLRKTKRGLTIKNKFLGYIYCLGNDEEKKSKIKDIYGDNVVAIERKNDPCSDSAMKSYVILTN